MPSKTPPFFRTPALFGWLAVAVSLAVLAGQLALYAAGCDVPDTPAVPRLPYGFTFSLPFALLAALGALILTYRPGNRIGLIILLGGACGTLAIFFPAYATCGAPAWPLLSRALAAVLFGPSIAASFVTLLVLLPLLFPDGHPVSPGWRRLGQAAILTEAAAVAAGALLAPGPIAAIGIELPFDNPLALDIALPPFLNDLVRLALPTFVPVSVSVFALLANASLIQRWRQAGGDVRQQLKWFAYFLATGGSLLLGVELVGFLFYPALFESPLYYAEVTLGWLGFPLVLGLAVFKYRLYAIDIVIRRTLIYGVVSVVLAVVYLGSVALLQMAVTAGLGRPSPLVIVLSTLLIAALFNPLRQRVQAGIDRRFYRRKYDAAQALARFALNARAEVDLDALNAALVAIVHETVQPAHAGLWLRGGTDGQAETRRRGKA